MFLTSLFHKEFEYHRDELSRKACVAESQEWERHTASKSKISVSMDISRRQRSNNDAVVKR